MGIFRNDILGHNLRTLLFILTHKMLDLKYIFYNTQYGRYYNPTLLMRNLKSRLSHFMKIIRVSESVIHLIVKISGPDRSTITNYYFIY